MPVTTADYSKVDKVRSSKTPWLRMMKHPAVWAIVVRTVLTQQVPVMLLLLCMPP